MSNKRFFQLREWVRALAKKVLPLRVKIWIQEQIWKQSHPRFGNLRRVTPICPFYYKRGLPIDRYYIEKFLSACASDVKGHVLEMADATYTLKYGGERVSHSDVMHVVEGNPAATIVADLTQADHIPSNTFDCIILTQTLQMIYDFRAALRHLHRMLKTGGVLLVTSAGLAKIVRIEGIDPWGEYWHFTSQSMRHIFQEVFGEASVSVEAYGNVLAAVAHLHGLAANELRREELDYFDPCYEMIIAIRAVKADGASALRVSTKQSKTLEKRTNEREVPEHQCKLYRL